MLTNKYIVLLYNMFKITHNNINNNKDNNNNNNKQILLKIYNQPYTLFKQFYDPIIPLKIFQTWNTKNLPPKMAERVENLKLTNPKFEHFLFDDIFFL